MDLYPLNNDRVCVSFSLSEVIDYFYEVISEWKDGTEYQIRPAFEEWLNTFYDSDYFHNRVGGKHGDDRIALILPDKDHLMYMKLKWLS